MMRVASLLLALSLLSSAATAYAECAWVLWEETIASAASTTPRAGLSTQPLGRKSVCRQKMTETMTRLVEKKEKTHKFRSATTLEVVAPLETYFIRFVCLPDTVDPRGPKGK
jgi:hypothetical protein